MAKTSWIQDSFNAGEISPKLRGRSDLNKYKNGCETLENFIPQVYGPVAKRPGTRFVRETKDSTKNSILVSFQYNVDQSYILEFGDEYIRFYKEGGIILDASVPYEIVSPYDHLGLRNLQITQSADVMYIVHPNYPPYELLRYDETDWVIQEIEFKWPPFNDESTDDTTITASDVTGSITLTSSVSLFVSTDVGGYVKFSEEIASKYDDWEAATSVTTGDYRYYNVNLYVAATSATTGTRPPIHLDGDESDGGVDWTYVHSGSGYAEITGYTSDTVVDATVTKTLPNSSTSGSDRWAVSAWSETNGYPATICFYEDRLWLGGSAVRPQTIWASVSGDYKNHFYGTNDDDALNYTINSQQLNAILWMSPGKVLAIGTSGGEFIVSASSLNEAVTPTNVKITPQTTYGSNSIQPYKIGGSILFVQRSSHKIRELTYKFESDSYVAPDLTILSEHLTQNGFVDMTYQQEPDQIIWVIDAQGSLYGMTYERSEDVVGWHKHDIKGSVESISTIPHWDGDQDSLWLIVNRTIDGSTVRYIEYMEKVLTDNYAFYMDCGLTYDGSPATMISGLDHLEGEEVAILADGSAHTNVTVSSGQIVLDRSASVISIGLSFTSTIKTMPIDAGAADGTAQGKTMRINNLTFRLIDTAPGLWYGPCDTCMDELQLRTTVMDMDAAIPLFTGDTEYLPWPGEYEQGAQIMIEHRLPLPCTIVALMPQLNTYDR